MSSKLMKLSFPVEDSDVYALLSSKSKPSKFVVEAVRFYQANKNQKKPQQNSKQDIESIVKTILKSELSKTTNSLEGLVTKIVKDSLKELNLQQVTTAASIEDPHREIGKADIASLEDTSEFDFSKSIAAFDDDD